MNFIANSNAWRMCLLALGLWAGLAVSAFAQAQVQIVGEKHGDYDRIKVSWPANIPNVTAQGQVKNGVLVVKFDEPFSGDAKGLGNVLSDRVALARLGADGTSIRIALRKPSEVRTSKSYNVFAFDLIDAGSSVNPPKVVSPRAAKEAADREAARQRAEEELQKAKKLARPIPALPLAVRYAQNEDNTRIVFDWTEKVPYRVLNRDNGLDIVFDEAAIPDLSELQAELPGGLQNIKSQVRSGKTIVSIDLKPGHVGNVLREGAQVFVDLSVPRKTPKPEPQVARHEEPAQTHAPDTHAPDNHVQPVRASADDAPHAEAAVLHAEEPAQSQPQAQPASYHDDSDRPDPVPESGEVDAKVSAPGSNLSIQFDWAAPVGAAVFRRGDSIWIIFDAEARLGLNELTNLGNRHVMGRTPLSGAGYTGVRIQTPPSTQVEVRPNGDGSEWNFVLTDKLRLPIEPIDLRREADGSGPGRIAARVPGIGRLVWVKDSRVGDKIAVVTGHGPAAGVPEERKFVEVNALESAEGLAFEVNADGLEMGIDGQGLFEIRSHRGLTLTPSARPLNLPGQGKAQTEANQPMLPVTASPGFIDFAGWKKLGAGGNYNEAFAALMRRVAVEDTNPETRLILARFLVANQMGAEALGALSLAQKLDPMLVQDARFRALRGVANLQMGRIDDAQADFNAQTLNRDPSAALWRGYLAAKKQQWTEARKDFEAGRDAFYLFTPEWQAKFHTAFAEAALHLNDLGTARAQLQEVFGDGLTLDTQLEAQLVRAELSEANGDGNEAESILKNLIATNYEPVTVRAIFMDTQLRLKDGKISPLQASDILENLRYRWRGDELELEVVRTLGKFYIKAGDYRRGMEAMALAARRFPDSPVARKLEDDLRKTYLDLFLRGGADAMDPVQAVALFYEFYQYVPITSDGDRMVRRLADRLIAFDLLPQAAELLQHQVDTKLYGMHKAQVATDLALVYLMDHKPEKALAAIRNTRLARLPKSLNQQRRLIEARALVDLGRPDHAQDLIEMDHTRDADFLRADIAWNGQKWPNIDRVLGRTVKRWLEPGEDLTDAEASLVLRATLASALADDKPQFNALINKWSSTMAKSSFAAAYKLIGSRTDLTGVEVKDLASTIGGTATMRSYLDEYRARVAARDTDPDANAGNGAS